MENQGMNCLPTKANRRCAMFEDSLLDSTARDKTNKPATIAISFCIQTVAIGIAMLVPLVYTQALPQHMLTRLLMMPPPAPSRPALPPPAIRVRVTQAQPRPFTQPR